MCFFRQMIIPPKNPENLPRHSKRMSMVHSAGGPWRTPLESAGDRVVIYGDSMGMWIYPLVNIQKTMENHHFQWVNPL